MPRGGWLAWSAADAALLVFDDGAWRGAAGTLAALGINTDADTTNRLAVGAPASLFTHDGTDHRLKINKAGSLDTASVLYQSGFSGRAEFGLIGEDDFSLKVSADGTNWQDAITIKNATGECALRKPVFRAELSSDGTINTTETLLPFDTISVDVGGYFDSAAHRYVPPSGLYCLKASVYLSASEADIVNDLRINKNGSQIARFRLRTGASGSHTLFTSVIVEADGTDYFDVTGDTQTSAKSVSDHEALTYFQGFAL